MRTSPQSRSLARRGAVLAVVTVAALVSPLLATTGNAAVVGACGGVLPIPAPSNLVEGHVEGVRTHLLDSLTTEQVKQLAEICKVIAERLRESGSSCGDDENTGC